MKCFLSLTVIQDLERLVEELRHQTNEQRVLLEMFSESWRADCARHHEETINAVKSTAQEQVPYNVEGVSIHPWSINLDGG